MNSKGYLVTQNCVGNSTKGMDFLNLCPLGTAPPVSNDRMLQAKKSEKLRCAESCIKKNRQK